MPKKITEKKEKAVAKKNPTRDFAIALAKAALDTKAENVVILDVSQKSGFTDYLIIASSTNSRQTLAIADRMEEASFKMTKRHPLGFEGRELGQWVLIDFGDVVAHVFLDEMREFYSLESLWYDAKKVKIPN